ncbi:hypothetical protein ABIC08_004932 [Bradyrhizobium sp. RT9b]
MTSPMAWPRRSGATIEATSGTIIWIAAQEAPRMNVASNSSDGVGASAVASAAKIAQPSVRRIRRRFSMRSTSGTSNNRPSA